MARRLPAPFVFLASETLGGFFFRMYSVVFTVYLIREVGLDPLQLVLMGTVLEATYFLFEIPTGVVADVVSRKASVVIGWVLTGLAFLTLGLVRSFGGALLTQVLWGFGATFSSGADVAWITDEVGEQAARPLYLRAGQRANLGGLAGIAVGIALATVSLPLPIVVAGIGVMVVGIVLIVVMPEEHFVKPVRGEGQRMHHSLRETLGASVRAIRGHPVLLLILGVAALHGMSTEGFDRLADFHILEDIGLPSFWTFDRIVWFGVIDAGALVLGIVVTEVVRRRVDLEHVNGAARLLVVVDLALVVFVVIFGLSGGFALAIASMWAVAGLRTARDPVFTAWLNRGLDSRTRATVNSIAEQSDAIGQTVGGPVLGVIARTVSVPAAIVVSGLVRLPALLLYGRAIRRGTEGALRAEEVADPAARPREQPDGGTRALRPREDQ
jgi:DHA3 family tetracycline resistance protein-like MFS transporter